MNKLIFILCVVIVGHYFTQFAAAHDFSVTNKLKPLSKTKAIKAGALVGRNHVKKYNPYLFGRDAAQKYMGQKPTVINVTFKN